jgi:hypothetical protein
VEGDSRILKDAYDDVSIPKNWHLQL